MIISWKTLVSKGFKAEYKLNFFRNELIIHIDDYGKYFIEPKKD